MARLISKIIVQQLRATYSSTEFCENGTLSSPLAEPENGRIIHRKRAMVRMTVRAVCLVAATDLLLLRVGEVFILGVCKGV